MRLEFVDRIKAGEILGKSIYNSDGNKLLDAGSVLDTIYLKKLKDLGVIYAYVEDARLDDIGKDDEEFDELKQTTLKSMSEIVRGVYNYNKNVLKESLKVVEDLVDYIIENNEVNGGLLDIQTYDNYTYIHSIGTCIMSTLLGLSLGMKNEEVKELGVGAILHDIGKTRISLGIINKGGPLTIEEYETIKMHPIYGKEILSEIVSVSENTVETVLQHHERVDGTGYPYGLRRDEIARSAKIVGICDVYNAITNDRSYREKFNAKQSFDMIISGNGTLFDETVVDKFKKTFAIYPLGCCVRLNNGIEGYVIKQNKKYPDRPVIRIFYEGVSKKTVPFFEINLKEDMGLEIVDIV